MNWISNWHFLLFIIQTEFIADIGTDGTITIKNNDFGLDLVSFSAFFNMSTFVIIFMKNKVLSKF